MKTGEGEALDTLSKEGMLRPDNKKRIYWMGNTFNNTPQLTIIR